MSPDGGQSYMPFIGSNALNKRRSSYSENG
jgi:hypothetical protein